MSVVIKENHARIDFDVINWYIDKEKNIKTSTVYKYDDDEELY